MNLTHRYSKGFITKLQEMEEPDWENEKYFSLTGQHYEKLFEQDCKEYKLYLTILESSRIPVANEAEWVEGEKLGKTEFEILFASCKKGDACDCTHKYARNCDNACFVAYRTPTAGVFMADNQHKPVLNEVFADNGEHSHWELVDSTNGRTLWIEAAIPDVPTTRSADDPCPVCNKLPNEMGECDCPESWINRTPLAHRVKKVAIIEHNPIGKLAVASDSTPTAGGEKEKTPGELYAESWYKKFPDATEGYLIGLRDGYNATTPPTLNEDKLEVKELLKECDDYLSEIRYEQGKPVYIGNNIGAGSILHQKIKTAIARPGEDGVEAVLKDIIRSNGSQTDISRAAKLVREYLKKLKQ